MRYSYVLHLGLNFIALTVAFTRTLEVSVPNPFCLFTSYHGYIGIGVPHDPDGLSFEAI